MENQTVVLTGGNTGIGFETARELARRGARVFFTSRNAEKGAQAARNIQLVASNEVRCLSLDLASIRSIDAFAAELAREVERIDVLINNAGLILTDRRTTEDGFEATMGINHFGHFLLTARLMPLLREAEAPRIVNVASDAHYRARSGVGLGDLNSERGYEGMAVYARSKLANILFTRGLAARLGDEGPTVNALHPGVVATEFSGPDDTTGPARWFFRFAAPLLRTPLQGAQTSIHLASAPEMTGVTGLYYRDRRAVPPSRPARDEGQVEGLWEASERAFAERGVALAF